jgi:hypothetical protein
VFLICTACWNVFPVITERTSDPKFIWGVEFLKTLDFDKTAIFGTSVFTKHLVNFIIMAAGKSANVRYFNTKDEALEWVR